VTEVNEKGVPPPGAAFKWKGRTRPLIWSATTLHGNLTQGSGLLNNQLYRGVYRWNRTFRTKDPDTGSKTTERREAGEWVTSQIDALRIIDEDLSERAHGQRLAISAHARAWNARRGSVGAGTGRRPTYLLSGLLVCGQCGSLMVKHSRHNYACSPRRHGGHTARTCTNHLTVNRMLAESLLLKAIQRDLFTTEGLEVFKQEFERYLIEQRKVATPDKDKAKAPRGGGAGDQQYMVAIKAGTFSPTLKDTLEHAEAERARLQHSLQLPMKKLKRLTTALPNLVERFKRMVDDLARATRYEVDLVRGILHGLLGEEKIVLTPTKDTTGEYLVAELQGDHAGLIPLIYHGAIKLKAVTRSGLSCHYTSDDAEKVRVRTGMHRRPLLQK